MEGQRILLDSDSVANSSSSDTASTPQNFDVLQDNVEAWPGSTINQVTVSRDAVQSVPLRPNDLSNAQREGLLETEWASVRLCSHTASPSQIDRPTSFRTIARPILARLPSSHLSILNRADFRASIMQLSDVSLVIIPEWRNITKSSSKLVKDAQMPPS